MARPGIDYPSTSTACLLCVRLHLEAIVAEDDGAIVMAVADHAAHGLVDGPDGLLRVPLVAPQAGRLAAVVRPVSQTPAASQPP